MKKWKNTDGGRNKRKMALSIGVIIATVGTASAVAIVIATKSTKKDTSQPATSLLLNAIWDLEQAV